MKILWLVNYPIPQIARKIGIVSGVNEGWLTGLSKTLIKEKNIELKICFPSKEGYKEGIAETIEFFGYDQKVSMEEYDPALKNKLADILSKTNPDVIHLMGSEFPHCWSMIEAAIMCGLEKRTLISVQGLVSIYAQHYFAYMPYEIVKRRITLRDILKRTSFEMEKKKLENRGKYEVQAFQNSYYAMGRTEWDLACVKQMNPLIHYLHGGETLRPSFYDAQWAIDKCERHSIFVSQATYPIKGFHILLSALAILKRKYPDCKLYVASAVGYEKGFSRPKWRNSQYVNYICSLIKRLNLKDDIFFVGSLNEKEMLEYFLRANVFVSPSSIENSSNSIGEAMLLGMPIVASNVGGTCDILEHKKEGFLYPADEPYMLAHYMSKIFDNSETAVIMGENAHERAMLNHSRERNLQDVLEAYSIIIKQSYWVEKNDI